jgi:hypothetical protein
MIFHVSCLQSQKLSTQLLGIRGRNLTFYRDKNSPSTCCEQADLLAPPPVDGVEANDRPSLLEQARFHQPAAESIQETLIPEDERFFIVYETPLGPARQWID